MQKENKITSSNEGDILNILKGIGILFVVMGHCMSPFTPYVYMFHMSLFFFVSGYFFNDMYLDNPIKLIKNRIKGIYIKYIVYCIIFIFLRDLFLKTKLYNITQVNYIDNIQSILYNIKEIIKFSYGEPFLGAVWFLKVLFYINISFLIISLVSKKLYKISKNKINFENIRLLLVIITFSFGFYLLKEQIDITNFLIKDNSSKITIRLANSFIIRSLFDTRVLVCIFIFYLGLLLRKNNEKIQYRLDLFIVATIALFVQNWFGEINVDRSQFTSPSYFIVSSILGIYISIFISKSIFNSSNNLIKKIFIYAGKNSLIIMIFHILSFKIITMLQILIYNLPSDTLSSYPAYNQTSLWWISNSLVGFILPIFIKFFITKILYKYRYKLSKKES